MRKVADDDFHQKLHKKIEINNSLLAVNVSTKH
jgi:hypothetical protein